MTLPYMKPLADLAERHAHGTRTRYRCGCRCLACGLANSAYVSTRASLKALGVTDYVVSAELARQHLVDLRKAGVGKRSVSAASGVRHETIAHVASGLKKHIRESTERRIMAVTVEACADGSYVDGRRTDALIDELRGEGFTLRLLSRKLGFKGRTIHFYRRPLITAKNALRVERLHQLLMEDATQALAPVKAGRRGRQPRRADAAADRRVA